MREVFWADFITYTLTGGIVGAGAVVVGLTAGCYLLLLRGLRYAVMPWLP